MYLLHVIPISKGIPKDSLTYYSPENILPGMIIDIPIRKGKLPGLVIECIEVELQKSEIKSLTYPLRKISKNSPIRLFSPEFIEAVRETAKYQAIPVGSAFSSLTPAILYSARDKFKLKDSLTKNKTARSSETLVFQADDETRLAHYKGLIREAFAGKKSIFICVPTQAYGRYLYNHLGKGIENYTYLLYGSLGQKELIKNWNAAVENAHGILVIATPSFLSIPGDFQSIIIERESHKSYKLMNKPWLDWRFFIENYAKKFGADCIISDIFLRLETLVRLEQYEVQELSPVKWRAMVTAETEIVDMREYNKKGKEFRAISDELKKLIERNRKENSHLFIYAVRRGLAPQTICKDCGTVVTCEHCKAPVVLHSTVEKKEINKEDKKSNYFLCHRCGTKRDANELCRHCRGWNLITLGLGSAGLELAIEKDFPGIKIFRIDSDATPTDKKVVETMDKFLTTPGAVLLGTDLALGALTEQVEYTAIFSVDSLFSLPDFRINEKILQIILRLRGLANHAFLAQTRERDNPVWDEATKGNLKDFYIREIEERKLLRYPPSITLIKISYTGNPESVRKEMKKLKVYLSDYEISIFPAFIEQERGLFTMHALLRLPKGKNSWPEEKLFSKLMNLPREFEVNIDPENLL